MTDRPRIVCLMTSSLDGRLHPSRYTHTPTLDGSPNSSIVEAGDDGLKSKVQVSLLACEQVGSGAVRLRYAVFPDIV